MWRRIVVCVVSSGCGFEARGTGTDGPPGPGIDAAAIDASIVADAMPDTMTGNATDCWPRWLAHTLAVSQPVELDGLSTAGSDRDPWLSSDGRRLYFARAPIGDPSDIYFVERASPTQPFTGAMRLTNLNRTGNDEDRAALSRDEKTLVLASNRGPMSRFDIYMITRSNPGVEFASPDDNLLGNVNGTSTSTNHHDPFLTADGLTLYLAPVPQNPPQQHISFATRASAGASFSTPTPVPNINTSELANDADPALSLDERVIVFSSSRGGGAGGDDLYYATRPSTAQDFGAPARIPTVNTAVDDGDPMLSADGCELYFASRRTGGDYDLYVARVTK